MGSQQRSGWSAADGLAGSRLYRRGGTVALAVAGALAGTLVVGALSGCAGRARGPKVGDGGTAGGGEGSDARDGGGRAAGGVAVGPIDASRVYQRMGLIAAPAPVPFVGGVAYLAAASPDSTLAVVTLSLPNSALSFAREGERYRASYDARMDVRQGAQVVRHVEASEVVRVPTFKETTRDDESIIFQQIVTLAPAQYALEISVRDGGSAKSASASAPLTVPRLSGGHLSSAVAVYEAAPRTRIDSLPHIVPSPRSTVAFGRDSVVPVYLEGYGPVRAAGGGPATATATARLPLTIAVRGERGTELWRDTASLARRGELYSGIVNVPVSRVGVGLATVVAARVDTPDTVSSPFLVSFGDELPITSIDEMVNYLRFFTTPQRLKALRDTAPEYRAAAWAAFVRATDPNPTTPQNEALRDYFARLRQANVRFRDEGSSGWLSDRGRVYVTLGEPDQVYEQGANDVSQRGRVQVWEYRDYQVQLVFVDQNGFSRWRLTTASAAEFDALARRVQNRTS
ncbi:MAG: GWxTD domain-containing protein [Gemmatimonadaceae bacterium]